jgi:hypothetical protein
MKIQVNYSVFKFIHNAKLRCFSLFLPLYCRYVIHLWDLNHEGTWEGKGTYVYYTDFVMELTLLSLDLMHHIHMLVSSPRKSSDRIRSPGLYIKKLNSWDRCGWPLKMWLGSLPLFPLGVKAVSWNHFGWRPAQEVIVVLEDLVNSTDQVNRSLF